jgi:coproporphyrinogen III oxidase-like Fe-S oxidoreductase
LRLNRGINLSSGSQEQFENFDSEMRGLISLGLIEEAGGRLRLTNRGRLLSNEVFEKFITAEEVT